MLKAANKNRPQRHWMFAVGCALLLQALYPSGYMPGNLANGWIAELCPQGLPTEFVELVRAHAQPSAHHSHHAPHSDVEGASDHHAMGSCELGSSLDSPVTTGVDVALIGEDFNTPVIRRFAQPVYAPRLEKHQSEPRAPPFS